MVKPPHSGVCSYADAMLTLIATRYDRLAANNLAFIKTCISTDLAACLRVRALNGLIKQMTCPSKT